MGVVCKTIVCLGPVGSTPTAPNADVAQLVEHLYGKEKVRGSNPRVGLEERNYMAKKRKPFVKLQCKECKRINYYTHKSRDVEKRLELKKFCKFCRKHTVHKEMKK